MALSHDVSFNRISEGHSTTRPPLFDGIPFNFWKNRMMMYFQSCDMRIWNLILKGYEPPVVCKDGKWVPLPIEDWSQDDLDLGMLNGKGVNALYCSLKYDDYMKICNLRTGKEIWDKLVITYEGTDEVRETRINILMQEYELFRMKSGETISEMFGRFTKIVNGLNALGKVHTDREQVNKILRSLPREWDPKVTAISEARDLTSYTIDHLHGSLVAHEQKVSSRNEEEENQKRKNRTIALKCLEESDSENGSDSDKEELALQIKEVGKIMRRNFYKNKGKKHFSKNNFKSKSEGAGEKKEVPTCFKCHKPGHYKIECQLNKQTKKGKGKFHKKALKATWSDSEGGSSSSEKRIEEEAHICFMAHDEEEDEELINMQAKLDDLSEQMRFINDHLSTSGGNFSSDNEQFIIGEIAKENEAKFCHCGTRVLHLNPDSGIIPLCSGQSINTKDVYMTELSKDGMFVNNRNIASEQEERRMSDLSDFFCCSVASSADFQPAELSTLATEQELYNLRNECEEKDATIKKLTATTHDSSIAYAKRVSELEEVIRRKNMITAKLKKDILFLEQQISKLSRLRRRSSPSSPSAVSTTKQLPLMTENILYDMSSTSSSSSDSDSPDRDRVNPILLRSLEHSRQVSAKSQSSFASKEQRQISPLKENRVNRKVEANPVVRQRQLASSGMDNKKARRRTLQEEKSMRTSQKKWV